MDQNIVIVGVGLIGGSLAKAFRACGGFTVTGIDRDKSVLRAALSSGAIDRIGSEAEIRQADLLFLCLYPQADVAFTQEHLSSIRPDCLVTDTCGIKSWLCPRMAALAKQGGFTFVGGHPMAGKEKNGFGQSDGKLFRGASYILVPCGAPRSSVNRLKAIAPKLGFAGTVETSPEEHDRMIAFTSQLPHVIACAYVQSPQCPKHRGFSAGSYRDVSRVASINETMWTELFLENHTALVEELDTLTGHLAEIRSAVAAGDAETLRVLLQKGRLVKEALGE